MERMQGRQGQRTDLATSGNISGGEKGDTRDLAAAHRLEIKGFEVEVCVPPTVGDLLDELNRRSVSA